VLVMTTPQYPYIDLISKTAPGVGVTVHVFILTRSGMWGGSIMSELKVSALRNGSFRNSRQSIYTFYYK
jgi:hypothetical protein